MLIREFFSPNIIKKLKSPQMISLQDFLEVHSILFMFALTKFLDQQTSPDVGIMLKIFYIRVILYQMLCRE